MKTLKWLVSIVVLLLMVAAGYLITQVFPIISGYGAKQLCSCVMLGKRTPESVIEKELGQSPLSLGTYSMNFEDSTATASVFGLATKKAIYRKGLGCSLISEISEKEFRSQSYKLPEKPHIDADTINWPSGNRLKDTVFPEIDYTHLTETVEKAFENPQGLRNTRAIVVVYKNQLVLEKYAEGFDKHSPQIGWSMTKSITNTLIGILVKQGKLDIQDKAPIKEWQNDNRNTITLDNLLKASSGLEWEEVYDRPSYATRMLFTKKDMGTFAASAPLIHHPGDTFLYSSGTTNILSRIIRETVGKENYYHFPYTHLFHKIGMVNIVMETDAGGTFVGSSYSFATARDWARFGLLYLNGGVWENERILPEDWVNYTVQPAKGAPKGEYGAQFWLNAGEQGNPQNRTYPDVPANAYWAAGFEGQNVYILPSQDLVVVKLSLSQKGNKMDDNLFLSELLKSFSE